MKKRNLISGIVTLSLAAVLLLIVCLTETKLEGMMQSAAIYCLVHGFMTLRKYLWWNKPENRAMRDEILENEEIEEKDERRVHLRDKAGRCTYLFTLYLLCGAAILCGILSDLEVIGDTRPVTAWIALLLVILLAAERIIYKQLEKKY